MTKTEMINDIVYEMAPELTKEQADRLKITMLVKMQDFDITQMTWLPAVVQHDREWLFKRYMTDKLSAGNKISTIRNIVKAMDRFLEDTGKTYDTVTGQDITDYLAVKQYRDKIGQNYKATLYRWFSSFFGWAYRKHHIPNDIMQDVDRVRSIQKKKERLTDEEVELIREHLRTPREKALFELMLSTGMRVGEIASLNIGDIDLEHKRVNIYGQKSDRYRTGMLTIKAVRALKAYMGDRADNEPLFIYERAPFGRMKNGRIEALAKEMAERAGVTRLKATVHVYRKTFASVTYRKTKNILLVSKLLGHTKTDLTVQYYLIDDIDDMQYQFNMVS